MKRFLWLLISCKQCRHNLKMSRGVFDDYRAGRFRKAHERNISKQHRRVTW